MGVLLNPILKPRVTAQHLRRFFKTVALLHIRVDRVGDLVILVDGRDVRRPFEKHFHHGLVVVEIVRYLGLLRAPGQNLSVHLRQ